MPRGPRLDRYDSSSGASAPRSALSLREDFLNFDAVLAAAIFSDFYPMWSFFVKFFTHTAAETGIYLSSVIMRVVEQ